MSALKTYLRNAVASVGRYSGVTAVVRHIARKKLTIVCYHRVLPDTVRDACPFAGLVVTPGALDCHLAYCSRRYTCLPLDEALGRLNSGHSEKRPLLAITFDDGYWDNFEYARPILNDRRVRATFFVISSLIGSSKAPWYDRFARSWQFLGRHRRSGTADSGVNDGAKNRDDRWIASALTTRKLSASVATNELKRLDPDLRHTIVTRITELAEQQGWQEDQIDRIMNCNELQQLVREGHEIGSHTHTHPLLPQLAAQGQRDELECSRKKLEGVTGCSVVSLAYPNGDHDDTVIAHTRAAGYRWAVTTRLGLNASHADPFRLRRILISQDRTSKPNGEVSAALVELELTGAADVLFLRSLRRRKP